MEDDSTEAASSARAPAVGAPSLPPPGWTRALANTGASGLAAASLVLLLLYLTGRFLWLYNKNAAQAAASSSRTPAAAAGASTSLLPAASSSSPPRRAVSQPSSSLLTVIPVFFVLHVAAPGRGVGEKAECAVCLAEFGEREAGRLLPRCGHAFHEECIATWLRVSTTCPLCRAATAPRAPV